MIVQQTQEVDTTKEHRRRGSAFDTLANIFRNVKELVFQNGVVIRNRPGETKSGIGDTVFEILSSKPPAEGKTNFFFYGKRGIADASGDEKNNVNYHEMAANYNSQGPKGAGVGNGAILFLVRQDGVVGNAQLGIVHGNIIDATSTGVRIVSNGTGDGSSSDLGGSQIIYINTSSGAVTGITADKEGIQMYGLPNSSPGLSAGTIWNDGGTLKIV